MAKNILIVDDSALIRSVLSGIINSDARFHVEDRAVDGAEALFAGEPAAGEHRAEPALRHGEGEPGADHGGGVGGDLHRRVEAGAQIVARGVPAARGGQHCVGAELLNPNLHVSVLLRGLLR